MQLMNEITVAADMERTWATLLDIERVATCLPGATLEPDSGDGTYRGGMRIKIGPITAKYEGTARLAEVDEDAHATTLEVQGRELKGQGTAAATIRNRLVADGSSTKVIVETDMTVTGRQAQFGRGIMQDIAGRILGEFASRLETEILAGPRAAAPAAPADGGDDQALTEPPPQTRAPQVEEPAAMDLGSAVMGPLVKRAAPAVGVVALLALVFALLARGRRRG